MPCTNLARFQLSHTDFTIQVMLEPWQRSIHREPRSMRRTTIPHRHLYELVGAFGWSGGEMSFITDNGQRGRRPNPSSAAGFVRMDLQ
jgi:hypothetical protein